MILGSLPHSSDPAGTLPAGSDGHDSRGDRGASPIELAILFPIVLLALFASIQISLYYLAREQALSAAQQYITAERVYGAQTGPDPDAAGKASAQAYLGSGYIWLSNIQVNPLVTNATDVSVSVTGNVITIIPWLHYTVTAVAHGTVERLAVPVPP